MGGNEKTRFQAKNICDFMLYKKPYLFLLELKSTKTKSLPNSNVRKHQIEELLEASKYDGVICGLVIEFSTHNTAYFIEINRYKSFLETNSRKSLPIDYLSKNGIKIQMTRKKINSNFDIRDMIQKIIKERENDGI